jgi:5'-3' exonuclease
MHGVLQLIEDGATHVGVATDHIIESFRNDLWDGYKTGAGIERVLRSQFEPLEKALELMGVVVWPMVELEADDALASAAHLAMDDDRVQKICIWTPDKDLAQCVRDDKVVQIDRRAGAIRDEGAVIKKFGVAPSLIPDFLALVGDSADGYPGIKGIGKSGAAKLLREFGPIEKFPDKVLGKQRELALLFKKLATLRTDAELFEDVDELKWSGPLDGFEQFARKIGEDKLADRVKKIMGVDK